VFRLSVPGFPRADFVGHFFFMGALAFFADGLARHRTILGAPVRLGPTLVFAVAALDELAQRLSPRRSSSMSDLVADALGVTPGAGVASLVVAATGGGLQASGSRLQAPDLRDGTRESR